MWNDVASNAEQLYPKLTPCGVYLCGALALSLLVFGIFRANYHDFSVAVDYLALVAHRLY